MGEPLLHPQLEEILALIKENNFNCIITTNGTLIDKVADIILQSKAVSKIVFSLHSFEGNDLTFIDNNLYIENIINFVNKASKEGIINVFRLWNEENNEIAIKNNLNKEIFIKLEKNFGEIDFSLAKFAKRDIKLGEKIFLQLDKGFEWLCENNTTENEVFCYGLRTHFGVLCDGTVVPCCIDNEGEIPLGNCLEKPLAEILQTERAKNIYDGFTERKAVENRCKNCGFINKLK